ncbi:17426_t:CDS:1, partial [Cetraspora pellucida]
MTDNTKLKEQLRYSSLLGCKIGLMLPISETCIQNYNDVYTIVDKIQTKNAIALQIR